MQVWPGKRSPLGATWDGQGVNSPLSENATKVELCCLRHQKEIRKTARISTLRD